MKKYLVSVRRVIREVRYYDKVADVVVEAESEDKARAAVAELIKDANDDEFEWDDDGPGESDSEQHGAAEIEYVNVHEDQSVEADYKRQEEET